MISVQAGITILFRRAIIPPQNKEDSMFCPKCKNKKGKSVRVDAVSRRCPKCKASVFVDRTGKTIVRGVSVRKPEEPAAEKK